jgi:hypothetical protein
VWNKHTNLHNLYMYCYTLFVDSIQPFLAYFPSFEKIKESLWDHLAVCSPNPVARQRLGKHVPAVTNAHETVQELLDAVFSMRSVPYRIFMCKFFPECFCCCFINIFVRNPHAFWWAERYKLSHLLRQHIQIQFSGRFHSYEYIASRYETWNIDLFFFFVSQNRG